MKDKKQILLDIANFWDMVALSDEIDKYDFNIKGVYDYDGDSPDWDKTKKEGAYKVVVTFDVKNKKDK